MGNLCCVCRQLDSDDEATNALLDSLEQFNINPSSSGRPRGPPPPYQVGMASVYLLPRITVVIHFVSTWALFCVRTAAPV